MSDFIVSSLALPATLARWNRMYLRRTALHRCGILGSVGDVLSSIPSATAAFGGQLKSEIHNLKSLYVLLWGVIDLLLWKFQTGLLTEGIDSLCMNISCVSKDTIHLLAYRFVIMVHWRDAPVRIHSLRLLWNQRSRHTCSINLCQEEHRVDHYS